MSIINFKTTDHMSDKEQTIAYVQYWLIAIVIQAIVWLTAFSVPRGISIAIWGIPAGVTVIAMFKRNAVFPRHLCREYIFGLIGFIPYAIVMLCIGGFQVFNIYDLYYFFVGAVIFELGLVFFYAFYTATDTLEQRNYWMWAMPSATVVILFGMWLAVALTKIYI